MKDGGDGVTEGTNLVDWLAEQAQCLYLSDLHRLSMPQRKQLLQALKGLPPEAAETAQWREALLYLTQREDATEDRAAIRVELIQFLQQEPTE